MLQIELFEPGLDTAEDLRTKSRAAGCSVRYAYRDPYHQACAKRRRARHFERFPDAGIAKFSKAHQVPTQNHLEQETRPQTESATHRITIQFNYDFTETPCSANLKAKCVQKFSAQ